MDLFKSNKQGTLTSIFLCFKKSVKSIAECLVSILWGDLMKGWPNVLGYLVHSLGGVTCVLPVFYPVILSTLEDYVRRDVTINWIPSKHPDIDSDFSSLGLMPTTEQEQWNVMVSLTSASPNDHGCENQYKRKRGNNWMLGRQSNNVCYSNIS